MRFAAAALALLTLTAAPAVAQEDGVAVLLARLEGALATGQAEAVLPLLSPNVAPIVMADVVPRLTGSPARRVVIQERDREPLDGAWPGDGYRLTTEIFQEQDRTGRIFTARFDVRRPAGDTSRDAWGLVSAQITSMVEGLHRLAPAADRQFAVRGLTIRSEDVVLEFREGVAVPVDSDPGLTGLIVLGAGQVTFTPRPPVEREQVRLFSGSDTFSAPLESAFVRLNPADAAMRGLAAGLSEEPPDAAVQRRARALFESDAPRSYSLDLGDLSRDPWFVIPPVGDFLAELHTRGSGHLTYASVDAEAEGISFFERSRGRDIARYASLAAIERRGRSFREEDLNDVDVLDYDIDVTLDPVREFVDARARLRMRVRAAAGVVTMNLRLAEPLVVRGAYSPELGRLVHLRVRGRDSILVNLPVPMRQGSEFTVEFTYGGRLPSQAVDQEALRQSPFLPPQIVLDPYYLLSSRSYWYPQPSASGYASATVRLTLPAEFTPQVTGESVSGFRAAVSGTGRPMRVWAFRTTRPVRYLALVAARFREPATGSLDAGGTAVTLESLATPGISGRRQTELAAWAADIMAFYQGLVGDPPYPSLSLAAVEHQTPGGHSPPGAVLLYNPPRALSVSWRDDPASFEAYPEFFLAHELAHQWWGHGVGWQNYHEQWLSEGMAQYFAALYAERRHGSDTLEKMLHQFRRWTLRTSDQGPVSLGYRLGQIKGDRKVFRALVYNKAAGVLHTLRRLIGDEAFFEGLRHFYAERRFTKASARDLQRAFEAVAGRPLDRFFDQWIRSSALPRVRVTEARTDQEAVLTFEHLADVFDLPVTVTVEYRDGRTEHVVVPVTEPRVEHRLPLAGPVRRIQVNRDDAALAEFE